MILYWLNSLPPSSSSLSDPSLSGSSPVSTDAANMRSGSNKKGKSSNTGAIVGGIVGGLLFLVVVGVGVWMFLHRRATQRVSLGGDYGDYRGNYGGDTMSEHGIQPLSMQLYVRPFIFLSNLYILTDADRTGRVYPSVPQHRFPSGDDGRPEPVSVGASLSRKHHALNRTRVCNVAYTPRDVLRIALSNGGCGGLSKRHRVWPVCYTCSRVRSS